MRVKRRKKVSEELMKVSKELVGRRVGIVRILGTARDVYGSEEEKESEGGDKMKESEELVEEIEAKRSSESEKGGSKVKESKELVEEVEAKRSSENRKGGKKMKELKELVEEIKAKRGLLMEKVLQWASNLKPVRDIHVKVKGRYYPLIEKETGKLFLIDKVQGKKVPFDTLEDQSMKKEQFVFVSILAEKKEEIEKEVEEGKRKYLEGKLEEVNNLLNKF